MKTFVSTISVLCISAITLLGQGALIPPGAPAPVMKTLQQIEPRSPIFAIPTNITQPGSYYLTTSLTGALGNGIVIAANNVTVDLNGFELVGAPGNSGISSDSSRFNLCVRNGTIRGWGGSGVDTGNIDHSLFHDLRLLANGSYGLIAGDNSVIKSCVATSNLIGIAAAEGAAVSDCVARHNTRIGISVNSGSTLRGCVASANRSLGISASIYASVLDCTVAQNATNGIVGNVVTISRCTVAQNGGTGIDAGSVSSVTECVIQGNRGHGVRLDSGCTVRDCTLSNNGPSPASTDIAAIYLSSYGNRVEGNTLVFNFGARGIKALDSRNYIFRNVANNNNGNYDLPAGTIAGTIVSTVGALNTATNSNANASF
jgi:hypothetical protein